MDYCRRICYKFCLHHASETLHHEQSFADNSALCFADDFWQLLELLIFLEVSRRNLAYLCICLHVQQIIVDFSHFLGPQGLPPAFPSLLLPAISPPLSKKMGRQDTTLVGGAYAQAFALFNCAIAAGIVLRPLWTSFALQALGVGLYEFVIRHCSFIGRCQGSECFPFSF